MLNAAAALLPRQPATLTLRASGRFIEMVSRTNIQPQFAGAGSAVVANAPVGRSASCAADENTCERIRTVATRAVIPEAAKIMATMMNW